jgi:hypothetical protein
MVLLESDPGVFVHILFYFIFFFSLSPRRLCGASGYESQCVFDGWVAVQSDDKGTGCYIYLQMQWLEDGAIT